MSDPVRVGDVLAGMAVPGGGGIPAQPGAGGTRCNRCGARADWHRTVHGKWILIELGEWPVGAVPAGKRWRVAGWGHLPGGSPGGGTAVNLGRAQPSDTCRICHFDVCPSQPAPVGSPALLAQWQKNARG